MHQAEASCPTWGAEAPLGPRPCTSRAWWAFGWAAAGPWAAAGTPGAPMLRGLRGCSARPCRLRQGQPFRPSRANALHPPCRPVATQQASRATALRGPDLWSRICTAAAAESAQPRVRAVLPGAGGRQLPPPAAIPPPGRAGRGAAASSQGCGGSTQLAPGLSCARPALGTVPAVPSKAPLGCSPAPGLAVPRRRHPAARVKGACGHLASAEHGVRARGLSS